MSMLAAAAAAALILLAVTPGTLADVHSDCDHVATFLQTVADSARACGSTLDAMKAKMLDRLPAGVASFSHPTVVPLWRSAARCPSPSSTEGRESLAAASRHLGLLNQHLHLIAQWERSSEGRRSIDGLAVEAMRSLRTGRCFIELTLVLLNGTRESGSAEAPQKLQNLTRPGMRHLYSYLTIRDASVLVNRLARYFDCARVAWIDDRSRLGERHG